MRKNRKNQNSHSGGGLARDVSVNTYNFIFCRITEFTVCLILILMTEQQFIQNSHVKTAVWNEFSC